MGLKVPEYTNQEKIVAPQLSTPNAGTATAPSVVRGAFGEDIARETQKTGDIMAKLGEHLLKMEVDNQDKEVLRRETELMQDLQNRATSADTDDLPDVNGGTYPRPRGYLNRQLGWAKGATEEFDKTYPDVEKKYLDGLSKYQYEKLKPALDKHVLSMRDKIITHEANQLDADLKNTVESNLKQKTLDASAIRDPEQLRQAIWGSPAEKPYNVNAPVEGYAGNIDLANRPTINNADGSVSTEKSFSFKDEKTGKEVLIPLIVGDQELSQKEAIDHYYKTGENLGIFNTPEEADAMAMKIHERGYALEGGAIQSARVYNQRFDPATQKILNEKIAGDMVDEAILSTVNSGNIVLAKSMLDGVKDKIPQSVYDKNSELIDKGAKEFSDKIERINKENIELQKLAITKNENDLIDLKIGGKLTEGIIREYRTKEKINPKFADTLIRSLVSPGSIKIKENSADFNKLSDFILNPENKQEAITSELLKENAKGTISDDEFNTLYSFNKSVNGEEANKDIDKSLPRKSFLQWISFWTDEYAQGREDVRAGLFKNYMKRVSSGEAPDIAANAIINAMKKKTTYKVGQKINTPKGVVEIIDLDGDGEPIIKKVK